MTKALAEGDLPVLLSVARSVAPGSAPGVEVNELVRTSAEGWGETDLANLDQVGRDPKDLAGPVTIGVVAENTGPTVRRR